MRSWNHSAYAQLSSPHQLALAALLLLNSLPAFASVELSLVPHPSTSAGAWDNGVPGEVLALELGSLADPANNPNIIRVQLSPGSVYEFHRRSTPASTRRDISSLLWSGITSDGDGEMLVTRYGSRLLGYISTPEHAYDIFTTNGQAFAILSESLPRAACRSAPYTATTGPLDCNDPSDYDPAKGPLAIDVMALYTLEACAALNGNPCTEPSDATEIEDYIWSSLDQANMAFSDSGVPLSFNLVHIGKLASYQEATDSDAALQRLRDNEEAETLRDQHSADLFSLFVSDLKDSVGPLCGRVARVMGHDDLNWNYSVDAFQITVAFSPLRPDCSLARYTYAHENGHNLGLRHDPDNDTEPPEVGSFCFSFGHYVSDPINGFRTLMATDAACGQDPPPPDPAYCPRISYYSNPDPTHSPTGTPTGTSMRDNARVLPLTGPIVSRFRASNDHFQNRSSADGSTGSVSGDNEGATSEPGEPLHTGQAGAGSIWWSWTSPFSGTATFDTDGSTFDTLLAAYTGSDITALTELASNDIPTTTESISFPVFGGEQYQIAVDGPLVGGFGDVVLNWELNPFATDLWQSPWAEPYIVYLYALGVVSGTTPTTFEPNRDVNRAETLKLAFDGAGIVPDPAAPDPGFPDVLPGQWFAPYVFDAVNRGYVEGRLCASGAFGFCPEEPVSRYEAAKIIHAAFEDIDYTVESGACPEHSYLAIFPDVPRSAWYCQPAEWMASTTVVWNGEYQLAIASGYSIEGAGNYFGGDTLLPNGAVEPRNINRAEMAKVIANAMNYLGTGPRTLPLRPGQVPEGAPLQASQIESAGIEFEQVFDPDNPSAPEPIHLPGGDQQTISSPVPFDPGIEDDDGDSLFYAWSATGGTFTVVEPDGFSHVIWHPPVVAEDTTFIINGVRGDRRGGVGRGRFELTVPGSGSNQPGAGSITSPSGNQTGDVTVSSNASDPDGLARVFVTFVSGGAELDLCGRTAAPCPANSGSFSESGVDPLSYGASSGPVTLHLLVEDTLGELAVVDTHTFDFSPPNPSPGFLLTVDKQGDGHGTVSGGGLFCGPGCSTANIMIPEGASITLAGSPAANSLFVGFAGDRCYGVDPCTFTMIGDLTVRASFGLPDSLGVLYTVPSNGDTGVAPSAQPRIVFNREILEGPNFGGIVLSEEVSGAPVGSVAVISTQHPEWLFLLPDSSLARGVSYRVDIPAGAVVDSTGAPLQAPLSFTFTIANEDAPKMYLSAYPTRILEGDETGVSVWFETSAAVDRTLVFSSIPPGELLHPTEITLPAREVLAEVVVDTRLDHGSIADKAVTLQVSEATAGQVSLPVSIPNETPVTGSCLKWLAAGVIEDDDGDGQLEAGEFGVISFEVANICGSTILDVILETRVLNTTNLSILGGNPPCHRGAIGPGQSESCERGVRADAHLPTGDYFIEVSGTSSANSILDLARIPVVNNFLPDYEVSPGAITSNELDPGTVIDLPLTAQNRGDGFDLIMPRFEVHIELEGQEYLLYRTYANVRGDIWHQQSFELPLVVPPVPGTHQIRVTINPPGPEQLDESDFGDNDGFFTLHVASPNEAPVLDLIGSPIAVVAGQPLSFAVTAHDANGDTLSFALLDGPASATLQSTGPQSALFQWTPQSDHPVQSVPVEIEVTDGIEIDSLMVILDVEHQADLSITVDDGLELAVPGQSLVYTIQVQSSGPSIAAGLVAAEFPWLDDVSWTCSATAGSSCGASGTAQIADSVELVPGGSATYTVQGVLAPDSSGVITQEAEVVPSAPTTDPAAGNNIASDSTSLRDLDFGDAPDISFGAPWTFPTLLAADGARHGIDPAIYLGALVDGESDGFASLSATGDDTQGAQDEDGVTLPAELEPCQSATVDVTASIAGFLDAWVDFDASGSWELPGEQVFAAEPLTAGPNQLAFDVPCTATPSALVFGRFRFGSSGGLGPGGLALDGEVEDVAVQVSQVLHNLSVQKSGAGSGTVVASPNGINCGSTCSQSYPAGTPLVLSATPEVGSVFTGWSGASCASTAPCPITMNAPQTVTAGFELASFGLTVAKDGDGEGTVSSDPAGIDCGSDCTESFLFGTPVTISAVAAPDSEFVGWSDGGCTGTSPCVVTIEGETSVTATFQRTSYSLTVELDGEGAGNVSSDPAGISCGNECTASFPKDTSVELTTIPVRWSTFGGWSGDCTGQGDCTVVLDRDVLVTVRFDALCLDLLETGSGNWQILTGPNDSGLSSPWAVVGGAGRDGTTGWFVPNEAPVTDQLLELRAATTVTTGAPVLKFWHQFDTEPGRDGGVLEYSVDGGLTWWDILEGDGGAIPSNPARLLTGDYTGVLDTCCSNPLPGRQAWTGQSNQWQQVTVDLTDFAGNAVRFRWRFGADASVAGQDWRMDEIIVIDTDSCPLPAIFADGFESGDMSSWSVAVP